METITRQQRRYTERKKKKEENRKPQPVYVLNRYKGFIKSVNGFVTDRSDKRFHPDYRKDNRQKIIDINIKDIKKVVVERFDNGYLDEQACLIMDKPFSKPDETVEVIDLEQYHKEGQIKGLPDIYKISNTGFGSTRGFESYEEWLMFPDREYHPFIVIEIEGEDYGLPLDSWYLWVWNDKGDRVHRDETFHTMLIKHREFLTNQMEYMKNYEPIQNINDYSTFKENVSDRKVLVGA